MADPRIKQILDAVAKASSHVMKSADKAVPQCPNCGAPLEQPMSSQNPTPNRADTDYPSSSGNQPNSSEDR